MTEKGHSLGHKYYWEGPVHNIEDIYFIGIRGKGCVYIVQYQDRVKIGISDNPKKRLAGLQNGMGASFDSIWLIGPIDNANLVEQAAHNRLKKFRTLGEWFITTERKAINAVLRGISAVRMTGYTIRDIECDTGLSRQIIRRVKKSPLSDEYHAKKYGVTVRQVQSARASRV